MSKTAVLLGASGLTGGHLLQLLLKSDTYENIILFSRTPCGVKHPKIKEHIVDLFDLTAHKNDFKADVVFCCIGTTKSKTPDQTLYRKIDYGIPVEAAKLSEELGVSKFLVISALGANPKSKVFYNKVKGDMESAVLAMNLKQWYILQPSLIVGERNEKRFGEDSFNVLLKLINPLLIGRLKKYRSISAKQIAKTLFWLAENEHLSQRILSDEIKTISEY